jgi:hypothetical protein
VARVYDGTGGASNPFLHLSMHLSISEQCSIDQPRGIRQAVELLAARRNSLHDAHHEAMECLGQMLWESQRAGRPPDGDAYVECVQRRATRRLSAPKKKAPQALFLNAGSPPARG